MPDMHSNILSGRYACPALALLLACSSAAAVELPLWELGAGIAVAGLADYRGADESSTYVLPVPYIVYRGDVVQADRGGIRGTLFERDRIQVNLSLNGTPPAHSKDNVARRGMADLKPVFEVGPTVDATLWRAPDRGASLTLRAPLRAAITAQSSPQHVGWLFSPGLNLNLRNVAGLPGWNANVLASALFGNRAYHHHFYGVDAADVLPDRPLYRAPAGYGGTQLTMSVSKRFPAFWLGGFVRYDSVAGAAFADSPLVKQRHNVAGGIALIWVFRQSSATVDVVNRAPAGTSAY